MILNGLLVFCMQNLNILISQLLLVSNGYSADDEQRKIGHVFKLSKVSTINYDYRRFQKNFNVRKKPSLVIYLSHCKHLRNVKAKGMNFENACLFKLTDMILFKLGSMRKIKSA